MDIGAIEVQYEQGTYEFPIKDRWSYLWLAIGTLSSFFWAMPLAVWLSTIFFIRFVRTQKVWRGFILVTLASFAVFALTLRDMLPMPMPVYLVTMAISALTIGGIPYLADRLLVKRLPSFWATVVYPAAVTMMDYLGAMSNPAGSLGAQAYVQYGNLAFIQLASITGMWGITFLVSWLGPVANWAWERSFDWREVRRGLALYAGILLLVIVYGSARLAFANEPTESVRMHGITEVDMGETWGELNRMISEEGWQAMRATTAEHQDRYLEATIREAQAGAKLVHWPEMALMVAKEDEAKFLARAQQIARDEGIYISMALGTVYENDSSPWENKLFVLDPNGDVVIEHYKYGNAPQEGFKPGDGVLQTVETPFGTLSGLICNDTNHQEVVTQAGHNGTDLLLSPAFEYPAIVPMHAQMAAFRAIENGVTIVRQANDGRSIVIDPYGRTIAAVNHNVTEEWVTVAQVPVNNGLFTVYPLIGDLFAWLAIAGFVALVGYGLVLRRREKRANKAEQEETPVPAQPRPAP